VWDHVCDHPLAALADCIEYITAPKTTSATAAGARWSTITRR
jgi:hypothetical protein